MRALRLVPRLYSTSTGCLLASPRRSQGFTLTNRAGRMSQPIRRESTTAGQPAQKPRFSAGQGDAASLEAALSTLLVSSGGRGRWVLTSTGEGLERTFKFKTFTKTWDFMTAVALQCKLKNHHPEWSNAFNTTFIRWTTHNPQGLSAKDLELSAICDQLARDFAEIDDVPSTCALQSVADRAVSASGDCCTPKK